MQKLIESISTELVKPFGSFANKIIVPNQNDLFTDVYERYLYNYGPEEFMKQDFGFESDPECVREKYNTKLLPIRNVMHVSGTIFSKSEDNEITIICNPMPMIFNDWQIKNIVSPKSNKQRYAFTNGIFVRIFKYNNKIYAVTGSGYDATKFIHAQANYGFYIQTWINTFELNIEDNTQYLLHVNLPATFNTYYKISKNDQRIVPTVTLVATSTNADLHWLFVNENSEFDTSMFTGKSNSPIVKFVCGFMTEDDYQAEYNTRSARTIEFGTEEYEGITFSFIIEHVDMEAWLDFIAMRTFSENRGDPMTIVSLMNTNKDIYDYCFRNTMLPMSNEYHKIFFSFYNRQLKYYASKLMSMHSNNERYITYMRKFGTKLGHELFNAIIRDPETPEIIKHVFVYAENYKPNIGVKVNNKRYYEMKKSL